MSAEPMGEEYVRLGLAIDQHLPGYVDAYFGPSQWKDQATLEGKRPLDELSRRAGTLADVIAAASDMDAQRKDFLRRHVRAMQTSLRLLAGEKMSLADETEAIYDIRPEWIDESVFEEGQRQLDELLPPGDSLQERITARKRALEISVGKATDLLSLIKARLRDATRKRFPLPEDESFEVQFVKDQPWTAYNWYLGAARSRIEINTDLPIRLDVLVKLVAHEAYPGHHTEMCIKDSRLLQGQGRLEHSVVLLNSPSCVIAEGIATSAMSVIMPEAALQAWFTEDLFPRAGLQPSLAPHTPEISNLLERLSSARANAAFLMHDQGASDDEVMAYVQRYELLTPEQARKTVDFIRNPLDRSYIFTYDVGWHLLTSLFAAKQDVTHWFTRLLTEPVTPSQVRAWMAA